METLETHLAAADVPEPLLHKEGHLENTNDMKENIDIKYPYILKEDHLYKRLKCQVTAQDIIQESHTYEDIEIKSHKSKDTILVSRVVLAASSPFFKQCLKDMEDGGNITITDCCFESLSLTIKYLQTGFVNIANENMMQKVKALICRLQIGDFSVKRLTKCESTDNTLPLVKEEPSFSEDNAVTSYYNYIDMLDKQNNSLIQNKKKRKAVEWENDVISSLYKESCFDEEENDGAEDYSQFKDEDFKVEPKKSKTKVLKTFKCEECPKKFNTQDKLDHHVLKKHSFDNNGNLKCEHCPKLFKTPGERKVHEETHSKPHKCEECGATFGRKSNLIGHMRVHRGERPYMCDICGKSFPMQSSVTTHKRQSHPIGDKPCVCEFCERRFVSKSQLELHRRVHTGEKPWVCDTCGKGFAQKQNMIDHKRIHSDKMEYNCHTCGKQFKWKLQLERHMMDHSGVRPFPCDKCNLAFKCSNGLKSHMMSVHSDMKHFVCQHCGSGFSTSSGVSRHQKNNRCSGLKAIAASDRERQISSRGAEPQGHNNTTPLSSVVKEEDKVIVPDVGRESAVLQSMQYLHNIAAASTYPSLSLAMQQHRHQQPGQPLQQPGELSYRQ